MPTVNGNIYPDLKIHPSANEIFRIALLSVDEEHLFEMMKKLDVLKYYLSDIGVGFEIEVNVVNSVATDSRKEELGYKVFDDLNNEKEAVLSYATTNNIDLIYSDDESFIRELYAAGKPFQYADSLLQLENEIDAFVAGKNVAWDFNHPLWNASWFSKYIEIQPLMGNLRELHDSTQRLNYTPQQSTYVRALQHKAMQLRHSEEIILSLIQKKNYAERNYMRTDSYGYESYYDYSFEIDFQLTNFYILLSGTFDIIGRLLTSLYDIKGKDIRPNIEHANFLKVLESKNKDLYDFYSEKEMNNWMVWIKRKRNYVAHESEASYTTVYKAKKQKISDADIEKKVNAMQKWDGIRLLAGEQYVESQKEFARHIVRMHEDNEVYTKEAMQVNYYDSAEKEDATMLFHPLVDTKADYDKYESLIDNTARILLGK
ncbi:MAG: hypothetical protein JWM00_714 [Candidatus Saccharibacteria bacterium]|nr:hypothetical protein [Candidatus Saccharibacteria bacterium]